MSNNNQKQTQSIPQSPWRFFWFATKPHKWWALAAIVLVIAASAASQGTNYFLKLIVDAVEVNNFDAVLWYALAYPVAVFVVQILFRASGMIGRNWVIYSKRHVQDELTKYAIGHSHTYFSNRLAGSIMSKVTNVVSSIDTLIPDIMWTYINSFVAFLVTFTFIAMADLLAGGIFIVLVVVLYFLNRRLAPKKAVYSKRTAAAVTVLNGRLIDVFSNIQAVRQFSQTGSEYKQITADTLNLQTERLRNWGYTEFMLFLNSVVLFFFSFIMFWLLVQSWQRGEIGTGDFILIISLYAQITGTLIFIGRAFNSTAQAVGEMREGLEDLMQPHEILDAPDAQQLQLHDASIQWQNVDFQFDNKSVFSNFSLTIPAGQRLGLVGQSGAGKTTFVSLLLRQHDVLKGEILVGGQNISEVTQDSLREAIAVVPQEPALFHRSIRANIEYGKPGAPMEEIIAVAKKAQAHDFISELPEGYDTLVGERGIKLSGGQKQRVAIARAMLKDAPILVLDEATSALDSDSEVVIQKALEALMEGRTVIAIAHRLSTLRTMDRIVVLEHGMIIEDGTHESLSASGGMYQRLWNHQAGGFLQE